MVNSVIVSNAARSKIEERDGGKSVKMQSRYIKSL